MDQSTQGVFCKQVHKWGFFLSYFLIFLLILHWSDLVTAASNCKRYREMWSTYVTTMKEKMWVLFGSFVKVKWKWSRSVVSDFATPRTVAYQAPPSTGFSRQQYWSGLPFPSPGDLPDPLKEKMWILFGSLVKCLPNLSKSDLFSENWSRIANFWLNSSA